jgi:hypothetical protein
MKYIPDSIAPFNHLAMGRCSYPFNGGISVPPEERNPFFQRYWILSRPLSLVIELTIRFPSIIVLEKTYFDRNVIVILLTISIGRAFLVLQDGMRSIISINRRDGKRRVTNLMSDILENRSRCCWYIVREYSLSALCISIEEKHIYLGIEFPRGKRNE